MRTDFSRFSRVFCIGCPRLDLTLFDADAGDGEHAGF
jgi:hypothetical protein